MNLAAASRSESDLTATLPRFGVLTDTKRLEVFYGRQNSE